MENMNVIGIACEYNPFHLGHRWHIESSRRALSGTKSGSATETAVVCVMSGCFAQRGDVAVFDARARAEAAVLSGADLVLELPLPWALSSAEGFARGAAGILDALGIVTHMSFGSECGDIDALSAIAQTLLKPDTDALIKDRAHGSDKPYAKIRQDVLEQILGETAKLISQPNNILAIEYLKALILLNSGIVPMTVPRLGAGHDQFSETGAGHDQLLNMKSASELRVALAAGVGITQYVPVEAATVYERETRLGRGPLTLGNLEIAIISRLRMLPPDAFENLPDSTEGLHNRLRRAAYIEPTVADILGSVKSKRYALSRIRRMLLCAALGVTADMSGGIPGYTRLLAANARGLGLLRRVKSVSLIPIISKSAAAKRLPPETFRIFRSDCAAADLYALGFQSPDQRCGGFIYRSSPVILK